MKLTKAQQRFLAELAVQSPTTCASDYAPAVALSQLGLATLSEGKYGGSTIAITPAGRLSLSQGKDAE